MYINGPALSASQMVTIKAATMPRTANISSGLAIALCLRLSIDVPNRKLQLNVSDGEIKDRLSKWKAPEPKVKGGYLSRYAQSLAYLPIHNMKCSMDITPK